MGKIYLGGSLTDGVCAACVASCIGEARAFLWADQDVRDACDGDYMQLRVRREQPLDFYVRARALKPGVVRSTAVLRVMGFSVEGDDTCAYCGFATMDGEFPLCPDCEQCDECGHAEDCEEASA